MLVLTRKRRESVRLQIGAIVMTLNVIHCGRNAVKLGFDAPDSVRILRDELNDNDGAPAGAQGQRLLRAA